ncbi:ankyrin repeat-containing domain protein [Mycena amicta]|nr:ankyrin repeat-containing domain protein [Mycena amicta]
MSAFDDAAAYLSTSSSLSNVSSGTKLELYGLFKYITVSPLPSTSRPSVFDWAGRAKFDAWTAAGNTIGSRTEAETKYIAIAQSLGWKEGASPVVQNEQEDTWDSDGEDSTKASGGGSGGFGTSVSAMSRPEAAEDRSLHGLAVSNNLQTLTALVEQDPSIDLNARDEFGYTPLHLAADRGHDSIVEFLLRKGVERRIQDEDGLTAVELAEAAGHESVVRMLSSQ